MKSWIYAEFACLRCHDQAEAYLLSCAKQSVLTVLNILFVVRCHKSSLWLESSRHRTMGKQSFAIKTIWVSEKFNAKPSVWDEYFPREVVKTAILQQDPPNHKIVGGVCLHPPCLTSKYGVYCIATPLSSSKKLQWDSNLAFLVCLVMPTLASWVFLCQLKFKSQQNVIGTVRR